MKNLPIVGVLVAALLLAACSPQDDTTDWEVGSEDLNQLADFREPELATLLQQDVEQQIQSEFPRAHVLPEGFRFKTIRRKIVPVGEHGTAYFAVDYLFLVEADEEPVDIVATARLLSTGSRKNQLGSVLSRKTPTFLDPRLIDNRLQICPPNNELCASDALAALNNAIDDDALMPR